MTDYGYEPAVREPTLRFYTTRELLALTLPEPKWFVRPGLVARGAITEIDGKIKSAGKTTFTLAMVAAVLDGAEFLGHPTAKGRAIYVTEQSRQTFGDALRRAGLEDRGDELLVLFREDFGAMTWPDIVSIVGQQDGYDLAVFDTIGKLSAIRDENSAGEWSAAMTPVQDLAAAGWAVILDRHDRKGGGDVGDSGRGSSQASGDVDIILAIRRPEGHQPGSRRVIESLSRYPDTPEKFVVELVGTTYHHLGTDEAVASADARQFVSAVLGSEFQQTSSGLTEKALVERGAEAQPSIKRWAIQGALKALVAEGAVTVRGRGVANDPKVYSLGSTESAETQTFTSADQQTVIEFAPIGPGPRPRPCPSCKGMHPVGTTCLGVAFA